MNLILLNSTESSQRLDAGLPAAKHLLGVLKARVGTTFWCGAENAARGLATVTQVGADGSLAFSVDWETGTAPESFSPPIRLLVGLSRPQTMKKVFATASEIGCREIAVFVSQNGDPAYAQSSLWRDGNDEIRSILVKSAEQTCTTFLPRGRLFPSLEAACADLAPESGTGIALDVYARNASFADTVFPALPSGALFTLAIGSERGWTEAERAILRQAGLGFAHLGARVLRVETAVSVALAVAAARSGCWREHRALQSPGGK
ncbi:MAG: RNA methyltransferase [Opitutales bacterium]|nr:RNA methyltransferase [Opitutales bacterium]